MSAGVQDKLLIAVKERLLGERSGEVRILDVHLEHQEDAYGTQAWSAVLYLTKPLHDAWPVHDTRMLKRMAREIIDIESSQLELNLDGIPSVSVSTREAPIEELAPAEVPDAEESSSKALNKA